MKTKHSAALFAALFAAVTAMAILPLAWASDENENKPPSPAAENRPMPNPMAGMTGGGMMGRGRGGMMGRGMMGRHWMMRWKNPKEACIDRLAHHAAMLAYIGTKLDLTAQQRQLWQKVQTIASDTAQKESSLCNSIKAGPGETILDRLDHMREMMSIRLAGLTAALPELKSLYETLTPEQRAILDRPRMHRPWHGMGKPEGRDEDND
jgi:LTXXQ motif family protein